MLLNYLYYTANKTILHCWDSCMILQIEHIVSCHIFIWSQIVVKTAFDNTVFFCSTQPIFVALQRIFLNGVTQSTAIFTNIETPLFLIVPIMYCKTFKSVIGLVVIICKALVTFIIFYSVHEKAKQPCAGLVRSWGFQEVEVPKFQDNRHMKVVRLSVLRTGRLYSRKYSLYSFLLEAESTPGS
jgi:hypothetical protein